MKKSPIYLAFLYLYISQFFMHHAAMKIALPPLLYVLQQSHVTTVREHYAAHTIFTQLKVEMPYTWSLYICTCTFNAYIAFSSI